MEWPFLAREMFELILCLSVSWCTQLFVVVVVVVWGSHLALLGVHCRLCAGVHFRWCSGDDVGIRMEPGPAICKACIPISLFFFL